MWSTKTPVSKYTISFDTGEKYPEPESNRHSLAATGV